MKKIVFLLFIFLFSLNCFSQFSKTHYIPPFSNTDAHIPQGQFLYISSPSLTPVNFKIIALGDSEITGTVSRDTPFRLDIGTGFDTQILVSPFNVNSVMSNKGYIIEAEDLVYVNVRMTTTVENNHAGGIVSKGFAALGTEFRIGGFINTGVPINNESYYTFVSVLATENNTTIRFGDIKPGVILINNPTVGNQPANVILNRGESFVLAVQGPTNPVMDGLIGALVQSDKPIAVNCGSIAGSNGDTTNLDLGFDQIVSVERTGTEYIFIKGNGFDVMERPLLIAHENNTDIFLNGDFSVPFTTLNAGEYIALSGADYSINESLYVKSSKNIFAYQGTGGSRDQANQNMCFVPPLNCSTPKIIDNIPNINQIGSDNSYIATVMLVTETGANVEFIINGVSYTTATLPNNITASGPINVIGNPSFVIYKLTGLTGNLAVYSTKQAYFSYFGSSGAATYGGYYSGFTFKPEITFKHITASAGACIPNIDLSVNALTAFDEFQWYFNDQPIPGATNRNYVPNDILSGYGPGFYHVKAGISECNIELISDKIPISSCTTDFDNDGVNDNIDLDIDNDGITNCTESYGNAILDLSAPAGIINAGNYSNTFTSSQSGSGLQPAQPFTGNTNGSFVSAVNAGFSNSVTKKFDFATPVSLSLEYADAANASDLLSAGGDFIIEVPVNRTITVINPNDQILIDTNYDGIYESGITEHSSFQIRFRLNRSTPLAAGAGTFEFRARLVGSFSYTHKNLSDISSNRATFKLIATCLPRDTDNDGIYDESDFDSDNDGIPDKVEALGQNFNTNPFTDTNRNGLDDNYEPGLYLDTDGDGIPDFIDLDSDNDGIYDLVESRSGAADIDYNGIVDGNSFGANGYLNSLETFPDSGIMNFTIADTDGDGIPDYIDLDSDNDTCFDVTEATYSDPDNDGKLGSSPVTVDANGLVISGSDGYTPLINNNVVTELIAYPVTINSLCDRDTSDASIDAEFDTSGVNDMLLQGQTDIDITFTDQNGNILSNPLPNPFVTQSQTITARVTNNNTLNPASACYREVAIEFRVDRQPFIDGTIKMSLCDDLPDQFDGKSVFNTQNLESVLSGPQTGYEFKYFGEDGTELFTPFNISSQNVTIIMENPLNRNCSASVIIPFIVNPLPDIEEINPESEVICLNLNNTVTLNAGLISSLSSDYNYEWSRNGIVIPGKIGYNLIVSDEGIYTVKVTDKLTDCYRIRTNTVIYSDIALISDVEIIDLTTNNSITIAVSGIGIYKYSINNPEGPFQESPVFENINPGTHIIYVIDENGCGRVSKEIAVVGAPAFFTPNGDSFNDTWKILGVNPVFYPKSYVHIFDRFGKFIAEIPNGNHPGWDGTYNGKALPADDYWYVLYLDDGRTAKGHFSLKR